MLLARCRVSVVRRSYGASRHATPGRLTCGRNASDGAGRVLASGVGSASGARPSIREAAMTRATEGNEEIGRSGDDPDGSPKARQRHAYHWQHAFDTARKAYLHVKPPAGELSADWVLYAEWPSIVTCYNGIEMVMKLLLDQRGSCSPNQWRPELGHDLAKAWERLDQGTRDHVEYHYAQHFSLHYYPDAPLESATADAFMVHINGENNSGSVDWRYAPLMDYDDLSPPPLLTWTMFEVWNSLICYLRLTAASDDGGQRWCSCLVSRMVTDGGPLAVSASDFNRGDETLFHDRLDLDALRELFGWLRRPDNWAETVLTNTIRWLAVHVRDAWHEIDLREPLIDWLKVRADATMREMRESKDLDVNRLWHRLMLSNGRLQFGRVEDPGDSGPSRFEFSVQPPYESKFAVGETGGTQGHVRASDLLVGDAVGLPALSRLGLEPRPTPTGAALSAAGCTLEEFRLDASCGDPSTFGTETVWEVDTVAAHLCKDRVIGERTIGLVDGMGAKLTVRLGDDQQLLWMNDAVTGASCRDYRFVVGLPESQNSPSAVLEDLTQAGYAVLLDCAHRLVLEFLEADRSHEGYLRYRGSQWGCVMFSDAGTLTDIVHTRIREIDRIIGSRLYESEQESLRIENRGGDSVRVLADRQMRSATTVATETRLVGIMVRRLPSDRSAAKRAADHPIGP